MQDFGSAAAAGVFEAELPGELRGNVHVFSARRVTDQAGCNSNWMKRMCMGFHMHPACPKGGHCTGCIGFCTCPPPRLRLGTSNL